MSALDLFAMLNAPLAGNGAGAFTPGQPDGQADGAFAGLLAMIAPQGEGTGEAATAPTTASVGMSLAPFRFNGSPPLVASDEASSDSTGIEDADDAGLDAEVVVQAGLGVPAPPPAALTPTLAPALPTNSSVSAVEATPTPFEASPQAGSATTSPEADPAPPPVLSPEGEPLMANGRPTAAAPGHSEANAGVQVAAPQGAQIVQTNQTAQTTPASQPGAVPDPSAAVATPETAPETTRTATTAASADARAATEAARALGQQAATTALAPEAERLVQPPRPDPAQTDRRGERRDGESRSSLFATTESGEASRPSVAAPAQTNAAVAAPPPPRPGTPPVEARVEPAHMAVNPAAPDGEAAPEPARTLDNQSAASVREHLPSTLSRAGVETTAMLSAQIVRRLEARSTRFDMVLTPEHLGRVDVRMEVDSDGQLTARLAFDNPAAANELRGRADELRRQLEAAGFQMSDTSLEFAEREGGRRDQPFDRRDRAFTGAGRLADTADAISAPPRWTALSLTPEGVDMKV
ncbi:flagellar hook-length control protein FliK [Brevundimonas sp. BAL450]|uniref:flagellar hook-length control protein FliK n=1 Tax=Brevundimonas sp. BAL450 TaxID=1708162 RepID=UPI001E513851|nr:flagellar hook-length control protein FliK [Brevundimonas sp. BAL450]